MASYVSRQRTGAWCGVSRVRLISFDFPSAIVLCGDFDAGGRRALVALPSTLIHVTVCSPSGSSSLNGVRDRLAELCCTIRRVDHVNELPHRFMKKTRDYVAGNVLAHVAGMVVDAPGQYYIKRQ